MNLDRWSIITLIIAVILAIAVRQAILRIGRKGANSSKSNKEHKKPR